MANLGEVEAAIQVLLEAGTEQHKITVLHATTDYPTQMTDVNLRAMQTMAQAFKLPVGYSDHTPGIEVPTAAVALGASVIEKHFTLDRNLPGPDHKASLEPDELKAMGIKDDPELTLQIIATGMHLSPEFGLTYRAIEQDGFQIDRKVEMLISSDTSVGIAKSMGL
ncbi:unnamed protein product, partial [Cyprideis torosa]